MTPGRRSRPPNHDPGGAGHGLERRNNVAERMPAERRAEQSEVCDDEALPPPPRALRAALPPWGRERGPTATQRSGRRWEKTSNGMSELSPEGRSEGYGVCDDEDDDRKE